MTTPDPFLIYSGYKESEARILDGRDLNKFSQIQSITEHINLKKGTEVYLTANELSQLNAGVKFYESHITNFDISISVPDNGNTSGAYVQSISYGDDPANALNGTNTLRNNGKYISFIPKGSSETFIIKVNWSPENVALRGERRLQPFATEENNKSLFKTNNAVFVPLFTKKGLSNGLARAAVLKGIQPVRAHNGSEGILTDSQQLADFNAKTAKHILLENWGIKIKFIVPEGSTPPKDVLVRITAAYAKLNKLEKFIKEVSSLTLENDPVPQVEIKDGFIPTAVFDSDTNIWKYDSLTQVFQDRDAYKAFMKANIEFCTIANFIDKEAEINTDASTKAHKLTEFLVTKGAENPNWVKLISVIAICLQFYDRRTDGNPMPLRQRDLNDGVISNHVRNSTKKFRGTNPENKMGMVGRIMQLIEIALCSVMEKTTQPCQGEVGCEDENCQNINGYGQIMDQAWSNLLELFKALEVATQLNKVPPIDLGREDFQPPKIIDEWITENMIVHKALFPDSISTANLDVNEFYNQIQKCMIQTQD